MKRIPYLDFLKTIALICIILAHVSPPDSVFMLRNFDVVLMIVISAILGGYRTGKELIGKYSSPTYHTL